MYHAINCMRKENDQGCLWKGLLSVSCSIPNNFKTKEYCRGQTLPNINKLKQIYSEGGQRCLSFQLPSEEVKAMFKLELVSLTFNLMRMAKMEHSLYWFLLKLYRKYLYSTSWCKSWPCQTIANIYFVSVLKVLSKHKI